MNFPIYSPKALMMAHWKVASAIHNLKGITIKISAPHSVMKLIFSLSFALILT
jgi:hypothetical protein